MHGPQQWGVRSHEAARSVVGTFGGRVLGLPGTHLCARTHPRRACWDPVWNYWWQAHYLDALVDAGRRHARAGDPDGADRYVALGRRVLWSMWLRNGGRFTNEYYDDMAWLVMAAQRWAALSTDLGLSNVRLADLAARQITPQLRSAATPDLGGGLFWSAARDRKNVPATGPAAIHFARSGNLALARGLVEWIVTTLYDAVDGLVLDSVFLDGHRQETIYTYNQGVLLGALLELGDQESLRRAEALVTAVDAHLRAVPDRPVLRTDGTGDGGLFAGVLARYLALAAQDPRLAVRVRRTAADLVVGTAQALWVGSQERSAPTRVFSPDPLRPAAEALRPGAVLESSCQVQAWMFLEAAAQLTGSASAASLSGDPSRPGPE